MKNKTGKYVWLLLYLVTALFPACYLLLFGGGQGVEHLLSKRRMGLMENSLYVAGGTAAVCMVVAILSSVRLYGLSRRKPILRWFFLITAPVPSYIYALSYMNLLRFFGRIFPAVLRFRTAGLMPCILVESFAFLPFACAAALVGLEQIDSGEWKAALLMQDSGRVFLRIILPKQFPYVMAMGAVIFVLSITDYSIPSLFQVNVYAMEIFSDYSAVGQSAHSLQLAAPLVLISAIVILLAVLPLRKVEGPKTRSGRIYPAYSKCWTLLGNCAVGILILQIVLPVLSLLPYLGTLAEEFVSAWKELGNSFLAGGIAVAILTVPAAGMALLLSYGEGKNRYFLWIAAVLPLAIPGTLSGIGILQFLSDTPLHVLRGGSLMPALGMAARYLPLGMLIQYGFYLQMDFEGIRAARLLQVRPGAAFWRVELHAMRPGLVISGLVVFLLTLGDVGTALVLMPAGMEPLSVKIYNYLHYGSSETVAVFCLMQTLVCMLAMGMVYILTEGRNAGINQCHEKV